MTSITHDEERREDVVSCLDVIDLLSDDDEHIANGSENAVGSDTISVTSPRHNHNYHHQSTRTHELQIATFQSIVPQVNRSDTMKYLISACWNLEVAIDMALTNISEDHPSNNNSIHVTKSTRILKKRPRSEDTNLRPTVDAARTIHNDDNGGKHMDDDVEIHQLDSTENDTEYTGVHFIDSDFPPTLQSIDGRLRKNEQDSSNDVVKVTKCHCGFVAKPKQVQSDGPNYGRYYLVCGLPPRPSSPVRRKTNNTGSNDSDGTASFECTTTATRLRNPYVKDPPESLSKTGTKTPCQFFQWDTTGVLGTVNSTSRNSDHIANDGYQMNRSSIRQHISWYRFSLEQHCSLYPDRGHHHHGKVDVSNIQQGMVGDCWFLSALTVVAEQSYLIQRILPHPHLNPIGRYEINLFLDGLWQQIVVDSFLPVVYKPMNNNNNNNVVSKQKAKRVNCRNGIPVLIKNKPNPFRDPDTKNNAEIASHGSRLDMNNSNSSYLAVPVFCATPDRILWPALIEKAYAKAHGSYQHLSGGYIAEGLQDLTGAPCETYVLDALPNMDLDMFWMKLLSFRTAGFVMGVATYSGGDGLVGGHAYSILDVIDVPDAVVGEQSKVTDYFNTTCATSNPAVTKVQRDEAKTAGENSVSNERASIRLVRIRNPWGKREWKGDWSVASEQWTRTLRKRLGTDTTYAKGDGTFYMSFYDMLQRFHHLDVAKTQKGWFHASADGVFVYGVDPLLSSKFIYQLSVTKTTQVYLSIIQPKKRSNTKSKYWYCDPSIMLLRQGSEAGRWEYVTSTLNGITRQCHLDVFLEANQTYICIPWSCTVSSDHQFRFVTYSGSPVTVTLLQESGSDNSDDSLVASVREFTLCKLFSELLLCNDGSHIHPIVAMNGMEGLLIGAYGGTRSSFYLLAVNGSPDHYLSIRISVDNITNGQFVCAFLGQKQNTISIQQYQDFDVPPMSQQFLLVLTLTGTRNRKENHINPSFRFMSTWVTASPANFTATKKTVSLGCRMKICSVGQNALSLHCPCSRNLLETSECRGSIQTSFENSSVLLGRVSRLE